MGLKQCQKCENASELVVIKFMCYKSPLAGICKIHNQNKCHLYTANTLDM